MLGPLARTDLWAGVKGLLDKLMTHLGLGSSLEDPLGSLLGMVGVGLPSQELAMSVWEAVLFSWEAWAALCLVECLKPLPAWPSLIASLTCLRITTSPPLGKDEWLTGESCYLPQEEGEQLLAENCFLPQQEGEQLPGENCFLPQEEGEQLPGRNCLLPWEEGEQLPGENCFLPQEEGEQLPGRYCFLPPGEGEQLPGKKCILPLRVLTFNTFHTSQHASEHAQ